MKKHIIMKVLGTFGQGLNQERFVTRTLKSEEGTTWQSPMLIWEDDGERNLKKKVEDQIRWSEGVRKAKEELYGPTPRTISNHRSFADCYGLCFYVFYWILPAVN